MSQDEASLLRERMHVARGPLVFHDNDDGTATLLGAPCPFFVNDSCAVYDARPYNCRRFMCFRDGDEPFDPRAIEQRVITTRDLRRQYAHNQRKAQRWADAHGWRDDARA